MISAVFIVPSANPFFIFGIAKKDSLILSDIRLPLRFGGIIL